MHKILVVFFVALVFLITITAPAALDAVRIHIKPLNGSSTTAAASTTATTTAMPSTPMPTMTTTPAPLPAQTFVFGGTTIFTAPANDRSVFLQCDGCLGANPGTVVTMRIHLPSQLVKWSNSTIAPCTCVTKKGVAACGQQLINVMSGTVAQQLPTNTSSIISCIDDAVLTTQTPPPTVCNKACSFSCSVAGQPCSCSCGGTSGMCQATGTFRNRRLVCMKGKCPNSTNCCVPLVSPPDAFVLISASRSVLLPPLKPNTPTPMAAAGSMDNPVVWAGKILTYGGNTPLSNVSICQQKNHPWYFAGISDGVIVLACDGTAAGFDASSLAPLWQFNTSAVPCIAWDTVPYAAKPILQKDTMFWSCSTVFAVNLQSGVLTFPLKTAAVGDFGAVGLVINGYVASDSRNGFLVFDQYNGNIVLNHRQSWNVKVVHKLRPFQLGPYVVVTRPGELELVPFSLAPATPPSPKHITRETFQTNTCTGQSLSMNFVDGCNEMPSTAPYLSKRIVCYRDSTIIIRTYQQSGCAGSAASVEHKVLGQCYPVPGLDQALSWSGCV